MLVQCVYRKLSIYPLTTGQINGDSGHTEIHYLVIEKKSQLRSYCILVKAVVINCTAKK